MGIIRPAAVAGSFYPADPAALSAELAEMLALVPPSHQPAPKALIVPHAGYIYSGPIAAQAYALLAPARQTINRVVLIGPAHRVAFAGVSASTASFFRTPLGDVPIDQEAIGRLHAVPGFQTIDQAHAAEHSLEVHLPFLQTMLAHFTLLPLVAGDASDELIADILRREWGGAETLIVVSSDLSHYQDHDSATRQDTITARAIERFDAKSFDHNSACGRTPLGGLLQIAKQRKMRIERLDLRNSGDTAGQRDRVVGYGAWALREAPPISVASLLLDLARRAIARNFDPAPTALTVAILPPMQELGASFVTLHKGGELRGCIGTVEAFRPLAEDVAENAVRAAFADPRFPPLTIDELAMVTLSLSLLSRPEPMAFRDRADFLGQLRAGQDGLILEDQGHRALFLPVVWSQLPDPSDFIGHLWQKAGLAANHWSKEVKAWRFAATDYGEV